jgi:hypothetical protein
MDTSPANDAAALEAARVPALQARLDLLAQGAETDPSEIRIYGTTRPDPGEAPGGASVVVIPLAAAAGTVEDFEAESVRHVELTLAVPIEGLVDGADPTLGTIPVWARIVGPTGAWWADVSVSVTGDGGELEMVATGEESGDPVVRLFNGSYARISSAVFEG